MIRYPQALNTIEADIRQRVPDWLERAAERTAIFAQAKRYIEEYTDDTGTAHKLKPFWSEVKDIYVGYQHRKCIYCETKLEASMIQWDLEHFRPKSNVRSWPPRKSLRRYDFALGGDWPDGYYLLAYHPYNYVAACKTCNSKHKSDHFPIAGERIWDKLHPYDYLAESPYLVYPLGEGDDDPEDLITFVGAEATPKHTPYTNPQKWCRGRVIIDLFELNRDGLVYNRATWLYRTVRVVLNNYSSNDKECVNDLEWLKSEKAPFTNCARNFIQLWQTNGDEAVKQFLIIERIISTMEEPVNNLK